MGKLKLLLLVLWICMSQAISSKEMTIAQTTKGPNIDGNKKDWSGTWTNIDIQYGSNTTSATKAKFNIIYDDKNLYLIIEIKGDTTPVIDSVLVPKTSDRDNIELYISMDTITYPESQLFEGCWMIRKQRFPQTGGIDGKRGIVCGGETSDISQLTSDTSFKVFSTGLGDPYYIEYQLPLEALTFQLGKDSIPPWGGKMFKIEFVVSDNSTGLPAGVTQKVSWDSGNEVKKFNTQNLGLCKMKTNCKKNSDCLNEYTKVQNKCGIYVYVPYVKPVAIPAEISGTPSIFPNPVSDFATISFTDAFYNQILVYDLFGKLVKTIPVKGKNYVVFSRGQLSSGIYIVRFVNEQGLETSSKVFIK